MTAVQGKQPSFFSWSRNFSLHKLSSAAAPVFAGIVSLLNGARMSSGQPPLGFLNPFIYSIGYRGLNDIVIGGSKGCNGIDRTTGLKTPFVPFASWNTTKGWDPVTGYGTPNFPELLKLSQFYHREQTAAEQNEGYDQV